MRLRHPDPNDPIDVYYRYMRWMQANVPNGNAKELRTIAQKAISAFSSEQRYANDERLLYIWQTFVCE